MEEKRRRVQRRGFADFNLAEALKLLQIDLLTPWKLAPTLLPPSTLLEQHLERVQATFAIRSSEAGRVMVTEIPGNSTRSSWRSPVKKAAAIACGGFPKASNA